MRCFSCDHFVLPLPESHRFPIQKYARLRERIVASGLLGKRCFEEPTAVTDTQIQLAHDPGYLERVKSGQLSKQEIRRIGFPWSLELVERSRRSSGATLAAARAALVEGYAVNLAGGTHHASYDQGQGYCVFNDSAIATRILQSEGHVTRVVVLDCDVHQGNGTALIFAKDPSVYTFSIHGEKNFPFHKAQSDLDIGLPDGTEDMAYLQALEQGLEKVFSSHSPDLAIYLAGADPFLGDRLGRLHITKPGLLERDRLVLESCRSRGVPVAITMSGGYAPQLDDIVDIHFQTIELAAQMHAQGHPIHHPLPS